MARTVAGVRFVEVDFPDNGGGGRHRNMLEWFYYVKRWNAVFFKIVTWNNS